MSGDPIAKVIENCLWPVGSVFFSKLDGFDEVNMLWITIDHSPDIFRLTMGPFILAFSLQEFLRQNDLFYFCQKTNPAMESFNLSPLIYFRACGHCYFSFKLFLEDRVNFNIITDTNIFWGMLSNDYINLIRFQFFLSLIMLILYFKNEVGNNIK